MISYFSEVNILLKQIGVRRTYLFFLVFLFLVTAFIDLLSLGLISPYVTLVLDPQSYDFSKFYLLESFGDLNKKDLIYVFSIFLIFIFFLKSFISILIRWLITKFSFEQYAVIQVNLMRSYQNMRFQEFISRNNSEYIRNIRELSAECIAAIEAFLRLLSEIIIMLSITVFLLFLNYKMVLYLFLMVGPVFIIYEFYLKPKNTKLGNAKIEDSKILFNTIGSGINAFKEIKILSKENFFLSEIKRVANRIKEYELKSSLIKDSPRYVFEFAIIAPTLFIIIFLSSDLNFEVVSILPTLAIFFLAAIRLLPSIAVIVNSQGRLSFAIPAVKVVVSDLEKYKEINFKKLPKRKDEDDKFENLIFKNIHFKYENSNEKVFDDLNFEVKKNDCVGIIGESGIGKTTLIHIFLGLIKPNSGEIILNGNNIKNFTNKFKGIVSYMPQDPVILDNTVKKNITFENEEILIDKSKYNLALKQSNLEQVLEKLENRDNTLIGEHGVRFSGGQYKRIALARTFYFGKKIIVMDEATNSLDPNSEKYIMDQIEELKGKRTIIVITHKLSTLANCNKIYKIEDKKIKLFKEK